MVTTNLKKPRGDINMLAEYIADRLAIPKATWVGFRVVSEKDPSPTPKVKLLAQVNKRDLGIGHDAYQKAKSVFG